MNQLESKDGSLKPLIILGIIIIVIWILSFFAVFFSLNNWTDRSSFGDLFGGINSLFSGFALAGIIYTIFLQRNELKLQRLELIQTRKELQRTAEAQEKSELALKEQAYNMKQSAMLSALNSLLKAYTESVDSWSKEINKGSYNQVTAERKIEQKKYYEAKKNECIEEIELILKEAKNKEE